jgi:hypothetical protein
MEPQKKHWDTHIYFVELYTINLSVPVSRKAYASEARTRLRALQNLKSCHIVQRDVQTEHHYYVYIYEKHMHDRKSKAHVC